MISAARKLHGRKQFVRYVNTIPQPTVMKQGIVLYVQNASYIALARCNSTLAIFLYRWFAGFRVRSFFEFDLQLTLRALTHVTIYIFSRSVSYLILEIFFDRARGLKSAVSPAAPLCSSFNRNFTFCQRYVAVISLSMQNYSTTTSLSRYSL